MLICVCNASCVSLSLTLSLGFVTLSDTVAAKLGATATERWQGELKKDASSLWFKCSSIEDPQGILADDGLYDLTLEPPAPTVRPLPCRPLLCCPCVVVMSCLLPDSIVVFACC
eukprot:COSAG05_NODE_7575_length_795_cov_1.104885_2_plen_113_part_01